MEDITFLRLRAYGQHSEGNTSQEWKEGCSLFPSFSFFFSFRYHLRAPRGREPRVAPSAACWRRFSSKFQLNLWLTIAWMFLYHMETILSACSTLIANVQESVGSLTPQWKSSLLLIVSVHARSNCLPPLRSPWFCSYDCNDSSVTCVSVPHQAATVGRKHK